ncbi:hypothetical protein [Sphingomonas palmae]|nr:hypothetical protein [Sphingomonas palmae]
MATALLTVWAVIAAAVPVSVVAQTIEAPPPPLLNLSPDRYPNPGPFLVFFDDAGLLPEGDEVLRRAVEVWQYGDNEAFLLCSRTRDGVPPRPTRHIAQVAARLREHGAKIVVTSEPEACSGVPLYRAQRTYDSVEIRGTYAH